MKSDFYHLRGLKWFLRVVRRLEPRHGKSCSGRAWPARATCATPQRRLGPTWWMGSLQGLPFCTFWFPTRRVPMPKPTPLPALPTPLPTQHCPVCFNFHSNPHINIIKLQLFHWLNWLFIKTWSRNRSQSIIIKVKTWSVNYIFLPLWHHKLWG